MAGIKRTIVGSQNGRNIEFLLALAFGSAGHSPILRRLGNVSGQPYAFETITATPAIQETGDVLTTSYVDLRSDTVTRPTPAMRRAMAEAEVGDDVFGDDPTVLALERRIATLAGKEAALFVPSGTMGNQLAVHVQTRPADEVLLEAESHIYFYEQGGIAANSGCLAHPVRGERGVLPIDQLIAALRDDDDHVARVTLVCAENTHNRSGGAIVPLTRLRELSALARERGLRVHLDG